MKLFLAWRSVEVTEGECGRQGCYRLSRPLPIAGVWPSYARRPHTLHRHTARERRLRLSQGCCKTARRVVRMRSTIVLANSPNPLRRDRDRLSQVTFARLERPDGTLEPVRS